MHSHATVLWIILTQSATVDLHGGDRFLLSLPMFHVGLLAPAMSCICNGAALVIPKSFEPRLSWQLIGSEGITGTLMVTAMLQAMLATHDAAGHDTRSLRWFMSGAAPVPLNLIQACADKGFEVHQVYGLTESGGPGCLLLGADALQRAGSTGRGFLHTEARGVGLDGSECRCGDPGEVPLRGPNLMVGCWSRPDATAQAFTRDGWLRTGDVGTMDDEGFVTLRDRLKDMLISRGENVYPAEVENLLLGHPQIADAAVLGLPSPKWGEVPLAVLVKKPGAALTEADLLGWCKGKLASLERPKVV